MSPKFKPRLMPTLAVCALSLIAFAQFRKIAQAQGPVQRNIQYGLKNDPKQTLNVYGADPKKKHPTLLFIHGGGWVGGSKDEMDNLGFGAAKLGYVGVSIGYRFVKDGKNRFPAQLDDVQRAVRFLRAHASQYGIDPTRIGAMGFSAGGHLVSLLGTMDTRDNSDPTLAKYSSRVQCVVDLYGPTDFTTSFKVNPKVTPGVSDMWGDQLVANFLGPKAQFASNYSLASPIKHIDKRTAPFLIFHGAQDNIVPVEQSITFDAALRKAGIESKLVIFPNAGHAYAQPNLIKKTLDMSVEFFKRHLQK